MTGDVRDIVHNHGFTAEEVAGLLQGAGKAQQQKIDALAQQLHITSEAVRGFLTTLRTNDVPIEKLRQVLTEIADRHIQQQQRLAVLVPEDPEARNVIDQARTILKQAESAAAYARADALLAEVEASDIRNMQCAEALEREVLESARTRRIRAAAIRAERAELSLTRLDYLQAAQHFKSAANLVENNEDELCIQYLNRHAGALYRYGDEKGDNVVLTQAVGIYRTILSALQRKESPLDWAMTQNNLGNALSVWGERESGTKRLEEAVSAYRAALEEYARERVPLDWAMTQNNLGAALRVLGERESGTKRLEEAVSAYESSRSVYTKAGMLQYEKYFETTVESLRELIAERRAKLQANDV